MNSAVRAGIAFEAMLLEPVLRPLLGALGDLGGYGIDVLARDLASHDRSGFAALIDAALERTP